MNPFANITNSIIFFGAVLVICLIGLLINFIVKQCTKNPNSPIRKVFILLKKMIFWNAFLRYTLEVYLEMIIAFQIKLYALNFTDAKQSALSIFAVSVYISIVLYMFCVWKFLFGKFSSTGQHSSQMNEVSTK